MRASNLDGVVERALRLLVGFVQQIPGNLFFEDCTKNNLEFRGTACLKNTQTTCQKRTMIRDDLQNVESESDDVQREWFCLNSLFQEDQRRKNKID